MRRLLPLPALLTLALAAPAAAADTHDCVLPAGPGGEAMAVTLTAASGGCPAPGQAVPREWIVGEPRAIGAAPTAPMQSRSSAVAPLGDDATAVLVSLIAVLAMTALLAARRPARTAGIV